MLSRTCLCCRVWSCCCHVSLWALNLKFLRDPVVGVEAVRLSTSSRVQPRESASMILGNASAISSSPEHHSSNCFVSDLKGGVYSRPAMTGCSSATTGIECLNPASRPLLNAGKHHHQGMRQSPDHSLAADVVADTRPCVPTGDRSRRRRFYKKMARVHGLNETLLPPTLARTHSFSPSRSHSFQALPYSTIPSLSLAERLACHIIR